MLFTKNKIFKFFVNTFLILGTLISVPTLNYEARANEPQISQLELEAKKGDLSAIFELGLIFYHGTNTNTNYPKALEYFQLAAAQGYAPAMYNLGQMYYAGTGVLKDYKEAFNYFEQAAAQGYSKALFNVGIMYAKGEGAEKNLGMSYVYLLLGQSLEPNERTSHAIEYIKKNMSPKDYENAKEYIKALANS